MPARKEDEMSSIETMSREELIAEVQRLRDEHRQAMIQLDAMGIEHSGRTLCERLDELDDRLASAMRGRVEAVKRAKAAEARLA